MIRTVIVQIVLLLSCLLCLQSMAAQNASTSPQPATLSIDTGPIETAPVRIDGVVLFSVRGIQSYPAAKRASLITERIRGIAANAAIPSSSIIQSPSELGIRIQAGDRPIMTVLEEDAAVEGVARATLASVYEEKIRRAVDEYRRQRTTEFLLKGGEHAALAILLLVIAIFLIQKSFVRFTAFFESRYQKRLRSLQVQGLEIVRAERMMLAIRRALVFIRHAISAVLIYTCLEVTLQRFPWTRFVANKLLDYLLDPLRTMAWGVGALIPNLVFVLVAAFLTRYLLKLIRMFFTGIQSGQVKFARFDPEWALPVYRLVRTLVIALLLVGIYPYIPGAGTDAFKGISVLAGVVFSIGSSSSISNVIAGYMMLFRRTFKVGDRVHIGDDLGDVMRISLLVTNLKTVKNEEVIIPNSLILSSRVINYSSLVREKGLILHSSVTIGYDAPWRQVHSMLLRAAERTEGILREPRPFVLQKSLDDFYVNYEINGYTKTPGNMSDIYSRLHQNIQDEFNEHGVQIMSPHYENDPEGGMKVVPRERWFAAPARQPAETAD